MVYILLIEIDLKNVLDFEINVFKKKNKNDCYCPLPQCEFPTAPAKKW